MKNRSNACYIMNFYSMSFIGFIMLSCAFLYLLEPIKECFIPNDPDGSFKLLNTYFMCSVYALIFLNTIKCFFGMFDDYVVFKDSYETQCKCSIFLMGLGLVLSGCGIFLILGRVTQNYDLSYIIYWNEIIALTLFAFFVASSAIMSYVARASYKRNPSDKRFKKASYVYIKYLCSCDLPGLVGMVLIFFISRYIENYDNTDYIDGFSIGAMALHLIFSQAALALTSIELPSASRDV